VCCGVWGDLARLLLPPAAPTPADPAASGESKGKNVSGLGQPIGIMGAGVGLLVRACVGFSRSMGGWVGTGGLRSAGVGYEGRLSGWLGVECYSTPRV
jgi:hypothetical protein